MLQVIERNDRHIEMDQPQTCDNEATAVKSPGQKTMCHVHDLHKKKKV